MKDKLCFDGKPHDFSVPIWMEKSLFDVVVVRVACSKCGQKRDTGEHLQDDAIS